MQKPFAASGVRAARSSSRCVAVVRAAAAGEEAPRVARRSLAVLLAAAPVLLPASRALALIPDDDDEELIERARANRKARLASEKQTQQAFSRSSKSLSERGRCRGPPRRAAFLPCPCRLECPALQSYKLSQCGPQQPAGHHAVSHASSWGPPLAAPAPWLFQPSRLASPPCPARIPSVPQPAWQTVSWSRS